MRLHSLACAADRTKRKGRQEERNVRGDEVDRALRVFQAAWDRHQLLHQVALLPESPGEGTEGTSGTKMSPSIIIPGGHKAARHLRSSVTKTEAISLYRDILRTAKAFHWCDEDGVPWHAKLRAEARKEFEASREETDPLIIARMLVTGQECVQEIQRKFNDADRKCWERIQQDTNRGGDGEINGGNGGRR